MNEAFFPAGLLNTGHWLLIYAAISIIALILLIARYRLNPFITLMLVSFGLALAAGMPTKDIVASYEAGVGKTLGHIALIVALGTMLGKMMAESGGAEQIARTLVRWFGEKNVHWAMVSGLSVVHGLVPPHPAAMIAVGEYQANVGRTISYALLVGIPTAIIAG